MLIFFSFLRLTPIKMYSKPNIFDNMLAIMEKYATNLESQVKDLKTKKNLKMI